MFFCTVFSLADFFSFFKTLSEERMQRHPTPVAQHIHRSWVGLGSPSGDGLPITGTRKSITTTAPKDDAGKCESRNFKMLKMSKLEEKNRTVKRYEDFYCFDLMSIRLPKDQRNVWLFLDPLKLDKLDTMVMCQHKRLKMNAERTTTEEPHNKWAVGKTLSSKGVTFDAFIHRGLPRV